MTYLVIFQNPNYKNLYFIFPILCLWLVVCYFKRHLIIDFFRKVFLSFKNCFRFYWLSTLFLAILIGYGLYLPLSYDESYTFMQFVDRSVFYAACTYPMPNNHVLHSILSNISWHIFSWSNLALFVRLPSILASYFLMNFFIIKISKNDVFFTTLFFIILLFNLPYLSFSFQARGYSIQILFAVISSILILKNSNYYTYNEKYNFILLFSLLGLYTSPAYLYVFMTILTIFFYLNIKKTLKSLKYIIKSSLFFGLTILLLYAPIIVFRGYESIISNRFVEPLDHLSIKDALYHLVYSFIEVLGGKALTTLILSLTIYFAIIKRRFATILIFIIPLVLMLVLKQTPFTRVFLPLSIILIVLVLSDLKDILKNKITLNTSLVSWVVIGISIFISTMLFFEKLNGGLETSNSVKYLSKYFTNKNIYLSPETNDYMKIPIEANLRLADIKYNELDSNTELKKGSILIFSDTKIKNIKVLDSLSSLDKKVYIGRVN